jgi:demethylmenaquinone methyltransferase/2-methoxy-6-polyprenyl-1,4-benzoquinol methylase
LPALGRRLAGDADSYRYLAESIRTFPDQAHWRA